uniref:Uncharacterized protein n=1 Tax=Aplanochytrium stocchinoi TaxID=215587 RepID=A0A7S3LK15_9STRA|mmetsp:Transcript_15635/g.19390  ORF Transcript_15635/g.19390 Transcript_15635/m.19390 type:complete len:519 (+) Transcript_15635:63-1619(+)|eukprot:CAMPEP_0204838136 /NCGR_PEP_ID=MMETSP1346-20131115/29966_1 /ASSEMBLY_ACC=CAM_ASM_000771 /TAXON_ID=215587 /ORGANISM="Aplanochytrium stocchinoi, Strain GSBS06" /LENGTH=518 /DNA_ID=CAMNT_0051974001 /DNA_START=59 /DNA_END=1615 /DNA_ORIENTATION=+
MADLSCLPKEGVSLKALLRWCTESGIKKHATTRDVYKQILRETSREKISLAQFLGKRYENEDEIESEDVTTSSKVVVPQAKYYVIHSWSYQFREETLASLEKYQQKRNLKDLYVWLDVVSMNQHYAERHVRTYDWWTVNNDISTTSNPESVANASTNMSINSNFFNEISLFKKALVVWSPWTLDIPLTSMWCVWEMYVSTKAGVKFSICFSEKEEVKFATHLPKHFDNVLEKIQEFKVENCKSHHRRLKKRILAAIDSLNLKENAFNSEIINMIESAFLDKALKTISKGAMFNTNGTQFVEFLPSLSSLCRKLGRMDQCEELCRESVALSKKLYGKDRAETARDINNLAVLLCEKGDKKEAIKLHYEALNIMKSIFGLHNVYVATDLNNLASLLAEESRHEEAENLFEQSLNIKLDYYGPDHEAVAVGMTNLALLYHKIGKFSAAEKLHRTALDIRKKSELHRDKIAETCCYLADILIKIGTPKSMSEAKDLIIEAKRFVKRSKNDELAAAILSKYGT